MAAGYLASGDALLARADRAIADAIAIREEVRAGLAKANRRYPCRPWAGDPRPSTAPTLKPWPLNPFLDQWWTTASTLNAAIDILKEADHELDAPWHRVLPTIQTPLALVQG